MDCSQITHWCHEVMRSQVKKGGRYIDATMGNGHDTLFLCGLAGENGQVTLIYRSCRRRSIPLL
jgi:ubiquinone/menaquinone biosynthesis C-methylase UbiE